MNRPNNITFDMLLNLVPKAPDWKVDWAGVWQVSPAFALLDTCPQDATHHAEGDAGTHTRMVVEALVKMDGWRALPPIENSMLFWAACLHDIGKPGTTQHEDNGRITSRGHSRLGASIARDILRDIGVDFHWRENICGIIQKHQLPFWLIERPDPIRLAIETSLCCRPDLLCLHAHADALGRQCQDQQALLDNILLTREVFIEANCMADTFAFANDESRLGYLEADDRDPYYAAHTEHRCTAYVMSALPGSGKDTWIANNLANIPMVSLDAVRTEMGVSPTDNQGTVIQTAFEKARIHLRVRQDFVWNATNVTVQTRGKILRLLRDYNAKIHIVYIEATPRQLLKQNASRERVVPAHVIDNLIRKLEPPTLAEAHLITYVLP